MASPAAGGVLLDPVRALQHTLYRAAKADPGRRFHALWDKVLRGDVLWRAWVAVRWNNGAPGIDMTTLAAVEEYGVTRLLSELATELREGRYRPLPARRVYIPKPGAPAGERRPLSIPAVRGRIVQAACEIVLEPVFEADFLPCSFGFRPRRSAHDALQVLTNEAFRGRRWVVETDIASCFEAIPKELKQAKTRIVHLRVGDQGLGFLGFHHRLVRSRGYRGKRTVEFLARWPSDKAMQRARDRIRELTARSRLLLPVGWVVDDLNRFLRGWGGYFRYGHSTILFAKISNYARERLAIFIGKRHKRGRGFGWSVVAYLSPDRCGLISLTGTVIAPRAGKPWREKPHADGERRR